MEKIKFISIFINAVLNCCRFLAAYHTFAIHNTSNEPYFFHNKFAAVITCVISLGTIILASFILSLTLYDIDKGFYALTFCTYCILIIVIVMAKIYYKTIRYYGQVSRSYHIGQLRHRLRR